MGSQSGQRCLLAASERGFDRQLLVGFDGLHESAHDEWHAPNAERLDGVAPDPGRDLDADLGREIRQRVTIAGVDDNGIAAVLDDRADHLENRQVVLRAALGSQYTAGGFTLSFGLIEPPKLLFGLLVRAALSESTAVFGQDLLGIVIVAQIPTGDHAKGLKPLRIEQVLDEAAAI